MKRLVFIIMMISLGTLSALAGDTYGLLVGGSFGQAYVNTEYSQLDGSRFHLDGSDNAWRAFGGLRLPILGFEVGYRDLGKVEDSSGSGSYSSTTKGYDAFASLNLGLGPVDLFGKVGYLFWDTRAEYLVHHLSKTGSDPAWGVGAAVHFDKISIRVEWEEFKVSGVDRLSMASVGLVYTF